MTGTCTCIIVYVTQCVIINVVYFRVSFPKVLNLNEFVNSEGEKVIVNSN